MKRINTIWFLIALNFSYAQYNCNIFPENSGEKKACELSSKSIEYQQGSKEKQELLDSIIAIGPKYAWAYYQKSVPYLKRGFLYEGLQVLNKAIELEPLEFLCYRAYWYWQYKNYELCIEDLETYYDLPKAFYQTTPGGEKDMKIILGLAYAKTGNFKKGIEVINTYMSTYEREIDYGYADYLSLGMLYYFNEEYDNAIAALKNQLLIIENTAEAHYFIGLSYLEKKNTRQAQIYFKKSKDVFADVNRFHNINGGFRVYETDLDNELSKLAALDDIKKQ